MNSTPVHSTGPNQQHRIDIVKVGLIRERSIAASAEVNSPEAAGELFRQFLGPESDRELSALLCLDTKNRPTAMQVISIGTLNSTLIHPREVFKTAILANAAAIVCAHWHPSGDPEPSIEDVRATHRLLQSGAILGIALLDHLILGTDNRYISFKEAGLLQKMEVKLSKWD